MSGTGTVVGDGGWVLKATLVFIFGPNLQTKTLLWPRPKLNNNDKLSISDNLTLQFHHESSCHLGKSNSSSIHLRVVNSSFYILEDPSLKPAIAFASFREDPVYVNASINKDSGQPIVLLLGVRVVAEPVGQHYPPLGCLSHPQYCHL